MKKKIVKLVARTLIVAFSYQLVFPAYAYALTTGPSQPEVQSFEPVGTTEMVDMFTGDFNYNIPLMDVEGYPINIFYHSGVGIEQEASWVGLGWNINPGEINRSVRGVPDDFKGDKIEKYTKIKEEKDIRIGIGADVAFELFGVDGKKLGLNLTLGQSLYVSHNNYRGLSSGVNTSVGLSTPIGSTGINMGVGTQSGVDVDIYATLRTPDIMGKASLGVSVNGGVGYNSRSGLKDISLGASVYASGGPQYQNANGENSAQKNKIGTNFSTTIPVGVQNYVPVMTNSMHQLSWKVQFKVGMVNGGFTTSAYMEGMKSSIRYDEDATRSAYGYMYLNEANESSILDFSREKDGTYNSTLKNLPASGMAYDIYSVNGQGTGGMFRPFRNDIGIIYDPLVNPQPDENISLQFEAGFPGADYGEGGEDITIMTTTNTSGKWLGLDFSNKPKGSLFENVFFKQAGEHTYNQQQEATQLFNNKIQYLGENLSTLFSKGYVNSGSLPNIPSSIPNFQGGNIYWDNAVIDRSSRATNISYQTAEEIMSVPDLMQSKQVVSYNDASNFYDPQLTKYNRCASSSGKWSGAALNARPHQISQFTQTAPDGRRYVYGIPAMNNITKEVTMAIDETRANLDKGYVAFNKGAEDGPSNNMGRDNFYSSTITPPYAHSYLLTSLLSNDYVDILGDGPTDDDLGTYVKYNYILKDNDYRWRTPYESDQAQYNQGFWSDDKDGKGNYLIGSREQWYVRSIESKNYIAEFYTSPRIDAKGVKDAIITHGSTDVSNPSGKDLKNPLASVPQSYKLDSIRLFNKHDRYINKNNATPIKTVIFKYNYSLCVGAPNSFITPGSYGGKLTLEKIFIKYGNSQKNLLSPYIFEYNGANPNYNFAAKDRWGNYKEVKSGVHNYEFPYTDQIDAPTSDVAAQEANAAAWNLTDIKLPSGGKIHLDYESDDYSFVQAKRSMQMLHIEGVGNTKTMTHTNVLYNSKDDINDYVYFKRRKSKENPSLNSDPSLNLRENYLEGQDLLYYSFAVDVAAVGKYEHVNGYAKIEDVGICAGDDNYAYIKLKRDNAGNLEFHPIAILGMNTGRYHIPHLFYEGYAGDAWGNFKSLVAQAPKIINTMFGENPFKDFIRQRKSRIVQINNSWIRVQTPGLTKKGGGVRVKKLELSDNWNNLSGNEDAKYGKKYDYTIKDTRYGVISSGVASYEPMIGADENPYRNPVPYSAESGRGIPSVDFFQEEPFGESFFPAASVGYSSVKVSSIHEQYGRSSQALDEYLFYTAKDYPVRVDYTEKDAKETLDRSLNSQFEEAKVMQGYCIQMNDMHGKPKAVNNYVVHKDAATANTKIELITGSKYLYNEDNQHQLNNQVKALIRKRGTQSTYLIKDIILGQDQDFTIDSRQRYAKTETEHLAYNVNVLQISGVPIPVPTFFPTHKDNAKTFKSLVSTKIIQQYGILRAVESYDHGAKTITENLVYDAETGNVLLTRTNNEFNEYASSLNFPAYLAYEGMRPAYTNDGYEEIMDSLVVNYDRDGYLYTDNFDRFSDGDELLVTTAKGRQTMKLWVTGTGADTSKPPTPDYGDVCFGRYKLTTTGSCSAADLFPIDIDVYEGTGTSRTYLASGTTSYPFDNDAKVGGNYLNCGAAGAYNLHLKVGTYSYVANRITTPERTGTFTITKGACVKIKFNVNCTGTAGSGPLGIPSYKTIPITTTEEGVATTTNRRCALKVAPRYKDQFVNPSGTTNISGWSDKKITYQNVRVKVLRSGRRNNLSQNVQQTSFTGDANTATPKSLFEQATGILSTSVNTFTEDAQIYDGFTQEMSLQNDHKYAKFNPYVLGCRGNYRPLASFAPIAQRDYHNHTRYDGTYTMDLPNQFWAIANSKTIPGTVCDAPTDIFTANSLVANQFWKMASKITRYDIYGNALEEQDAIGNYSAAQYGYNKALPVSVASNAAYQQFMFEGFEEYNMLLSDKTAALFNKADLYGTFANLFGDKKTAINVDYPSTNGSPNTATFTRNGQGYHLRNTAPSGSLVLSTAANHTGYFSMKSTAASSFEFTVGNALPSKLGAFKLAPGKKYLIQLWAKDASTTPAAITAGMFKTQIATAPDADMKPKTSAIDGWYQIEAELDLSTGVVSGDKVYLKIPANVYIDDIRLLPIKANMKSFVYDPISFKLVAQLDENHFATFFEYDQEGLLVRTKKETTKGIVTISESRRANSKKTLPPSGTGGSTTTGSPF